MKSFIKKIIIGVLGRSNIRRFLLNNLLWDKTEKSLKALLTHYRDGVVDAIFTYPSVINNGYLHIERTIEVLKSKSQAGKIILDIGAAGGETCIIFSKAFPSWQIVGFEPILETFHRLEDNTKNFSNIKIHHTALGSSRGNAQINVTNRITASSLFPTNEKQGFNGNDYFKIVQQEQINIDTLDNFTSIKDKVTLIKIDVQGFELEVLKGGVNTLKRTAFVLLEMQNHAIYRGAPAYYQLDDFLRASGFELFEIIPSIRVDMQVKEFDALYINKVQF